MNPDFDWSRKQVNGHSFAARTTTYPACLTWAGEGKGGVSKVSFDGGALPITLVALVFLLGDIS